jgi:hypothetical protein
VDLLITLPSSASDRCSHCPSLRRSLFWAFWHKAIPPCNTKDTKIIDGWQVCTCFSYCNSGLVMLRRPRVSHGLIIGAFYESSCSRHSDCRPWEMIALCSRWPISGCQRCRASSLHAIRFSRPSRHIAAPQLPTAIITGAVIFIPA